MTTPSEGSTATIVACEEGRWAPVATKWVEKRYKRGKRDAMTHERRMHGNIEYWLNQEALRAPVPSTRFIPLPFLLESRPPPPVLRVPLLNCEPTRYIMELVDVSKPLWEGEVSDQHLEVLVTGLLCLWRNGYEMRDVEVYIQPDGSLCMLDFGQVTEAKEPTTKLLSAAIVPPSQVERLEMALAAKTLPPTVPKLRCDLGCLCQCCWYCSRDLCYGRCGVTHKQNRYRA